MNLVLQSVWLYMILMIMSQTWAIEPLSQANLINILDRNCRNPDSADSLAAEILTAVTIKS